MVHLSPDSLVSTNSPTKTLKGKAKSASRAAKRGARHRLQASAQNLFNESQRLDVARLARQTLNPYGIEDSIEASNTRFPKPNDELNRIPEALQGTQTPYLELLPKRRQDTSITQARQKQRDTLEWRLVQFDNRYPKATLKDRERFKYATQRAIRELDALRQTAQDAADKESAAEYFNKPGAEELCGPPEEVRRGNRLIDQETQEALSNASQMFNRGVIASTPGGQVLQACQKVAPKSPCIQFLSGAADGFASNVNPIAVVQMGHAVITQPEQALQGFINGYTNLWAPDATMEDRGASLANWVSTLLPTKKLLGKGRILRTRPGAKVEAIPLFDGSASISAHTHAAEVPLRTPTKDRTLSNGPTYTVSPTGVDSSQTNLQHHGRLAPTSLAPLILGQDTWSFPLTKTIRGYYDPLAKDSARTLHYLGVDLNSPELTTNFLSAAFEDECVAFLRRNKGDVGKYERGTAEVDHVLRQLRPNATESQLLMHRILSGPFSSGANAVTEAYNTTKAWLCLVDTGRLPTKETIGRWYLGGHKDAILTSIDRLEKVFNELHNDPNQIASWFAGRHSFDKLRDANPSICESSLQPVSPGKYPGSLMMGPKTGAHVAVKLGYDTVIKDRHFYRGANRLVGQEWDPRTVSTQFMSGNADNVRVVNDATRNTAKDLGLTANNVKEVRFDLEKWLAKQAGVSQRWTNWIEGTTKAALEEGVVPKELPEAVRSSLAASAKKRKDVAILRGTLNGYGRRSSPGLPPQPGDPLASQGVLSAGRNAISLAPLARSTTLGKRLTDSLAKWQLLGEVVEPPFSGCAVARLAGVHNYTDVLSAAHDLRSKSVGTTVIPFEFGMDGPDGYYSGTLRSSPKQAKQVLSSLGLDHSITFREGKLTRFMTFDPGAQAWRNLDGYIGQSGGSLDVFGRGQGEWMPGTTAFERSRKSISRIVEASKRFGARNISDLTNATPGQAYIFVIPKQRPKKAESKGELNRKRPS